MERNCLNPGDTLALCRLESSAADIWTITGKLGEGGSCVCYSARCGRKYGRLKQFQPLDGACSREEFLHAYELLEQAKEDAPSARVLNNFIPPYELLRSPEGDGLYVWTPDDKEGVSIESYLQKVWAAPNRAPEHKLYNILSTVITLTDCIRVLHLAGLLHLDIKPSNFLVLYDGQFNINPASISLFDVNTLHLMGSPNFRGVGTEGYCAPEVLQGQGDDNRSDIYSIGAMLLRAVASCGFEREMYSRLDAIVAESMLIRASESNSNVFLRHYISRVLKKCLAHQPSQRYSCCEELMVDLKKARAFLLPEVENEHLGLQKRLAVLDTENAESRSSTAVLHDLLFRHPLDAPNQADIRVLVVGAGTYGQKFIDICLQSGQMLGKTLSIRAVSQDPELDREVYLQVRPALPEFLNGCPDTRLEFAPVPMALRGDSPDGNREAVARLLCGSTQLPNYVFVALGDDVLNGQVARQIAWLLRLKNVHFVVQGAEAVDAAPAKPVYINNPLTARAIDPELENMAFNAHLCWMNDPNGDLRLARSQFRRKYNLEASLAYALSVGSKLRSVGIYEKNPEKAAELFQRKVLDVDGEMIGKMIELEHRRWAVEKITAGWRLPRAADGSIDLMGGILRGTMKDQANRTHPCIVPCGPEMKLKSYTRQQWDEPNPADETLDELDRVSLTQHRLCRERTESLRDRQPLNSGDLALMRRALAGAPAEVVCAFGRYQQCLRRILVGSRKDAKELDNCEKALKQALSGLSRELRDEMTERMQRLHRDFFPAVESCLYRDYKLSDEALVRQIPFVLTGRQRQLGTVLNLHDAIANVAAATVLRPKKITYFAQLVPGEDPVPMLEKLLRYFENRMPGCRVAAVLAAGDSRGLEEKLSKIKLEYRLLPAKGLENAPKEKRIDLFDATCATGKLASLAEKYPSFRFDPAKREFSDCRDCAWLRWQPVDAGLRLEDLDALLGTSYAAAPIPEFGREDEALWQLYREKAENWNRLCAAAARQAEKGDRLCRLSGTGPEREIVRLLPAHLYEPLTALLRVLLDCGAAAPGSALEADTSDGCRLRLITACPAEKMLDKLYNVDNWNSLYVRKKELRWDNLQIRSVPLEEESRVILEKLQELGLITGLVIRGGKASFRCGTARVKKLLTVPGKLGQLMVWQQLRQEGCFDSGACVDDRCVFIRGFRVLEIPVEKLQTEKIKKLLREEEGYVRTKTHYDG